MTNTPVSKKAFAQSTNQGRVYSPQQKAVYRRNIIGYSLGFLLAAAVLYLLVGVPVVQGVTPVSAAIIPGISFLLLGTLFTLLLYTALPFLEEPDYTMSLQYAGVISILLLCTLLIIIASEHTFSIVTALLYTSLFVLPYTVYQAWIFYQVQTVQETYQPWYMPRSATLPKTGTTIFLNNIPVKLQFALQPALPEIQYQLRAAVSKTVGQLFGDFIYASAPGSEQKDPFADIKAQAYAWEFFVTNVSKSGMRQIHANVSLVDNGIQPKATIIARRMQPDASAN